MAGSNKASANQLFGKISAYSTIVQQNIGNLLNKLSPFAKEYESTLDLVLDILRSLGYSEERLVAELLEIVVGDASVGAAIESGYHGALDSLERKLSAIETKQENNSFINGLEDAVKITISTILTSFLTCSISPFMPLKYFDRTNKVPLGTVPDPLPINIPTRLLDFSNTLHVSPVSESGIYFYNTPADTSYYQRDAGQTETSNTIADIKDTNSQTYKVYNYDKVSYEDLTDEQRKGLKKVVSVPSDVKVKEDEVPPAEFIYTVRPKYTAESLYRTDDMNAFIWYVANRGYNEEGGNMYEYNKMMWDSRRLNSREEDTRRGTEPDDWDNWLTSKTTFTGTTGRLKLVKNEEEVKSLYPVIQLEPSVGYGDLEHIVATFPAQTYCPALLEARPPVLFFSKTIYKFNADYLRSIKIFNWRTIIMNMLYELNGISPIPDIQFNLSLSDEIIDARLSTLILNTITADDKEVDDSYYSFSNEDYAAALKNMELKKYGAKPYNTAASTAIQNPTGTPLETMNEVSTAATLNEISTTITRGVYSVAGTSGSTGITKTTLSYNLSMESNFVYNLLFAIVKPFIRAVMSPQIMLLFYINLQSMGLINLKELNVGDYGILADFLFRKMSGALRMLIRQIKDAFILYLLDVVKKAITELLDEIIILLLLEQLNDYIRLLTQIMDCLRLFSIGRTLNGIDEVNYADIIPENKAPETQ